MKTFKIVVYAVLIVFHLTTIIVLSVGRNNFDFLFDLFGKLDMLLYGAYIALIFFLTTIFFEYLSQKNVRSLEKKHQDEINELKAKLYDKKESMSAAPITNEVKAEDSKTDEEAENKAD